MALVNAAALRPYKEVYPIIMDASTLIREQTQKKPNEVV